MNCVFSIIVPVYNAEKYMNQCIDSLVNQDVKSCEYEIILVNDGSTDSSLTIMREYEKKCERVMVLDQSNRGVATARNLGIKHARGSYILFVDSDDWIAENTLSVMYEWVLKEELDIVMFNYARHHEQESSVQKNVVGHAVKRVGVDKDAMTYMSYNYIWDKLYKKSIIIENELSFRKDVHFGEDTLFLCEYLMHVNKIVLEEKCLYNYRESTGASLSNKYVPEMDYTVERIWQLHKQIEQRTPGFMQVAEERSYYGTMCVQVIYNMYHVDSKFHMKERYEKLKQFFELELYDSIMKEKPYNIGKKYIVFFYKYKNAMLLDIGLSVLKFAKKLRAMSK